MIDDVPITDLCREVCMMEESEMFDAFSADDRKELLFRIFQHVLFGGASNQYEDHVEEYFNVTKRLYKDLLSVRKNDAGDVEVVSWAFQIESLGAGGELFPKDHRTNFCYLMVDKIVRHITLWHFAYRPVW